MTQADVIRTRCYQTWHDGRIWTARLGCGLIVFQALLALSNLTLAEREDETT